MARIVFEEKYKVIFAPTVASVSAPTVANLTAGEDLTAFVPKDGVQPGVGNNRVSTAAIDTKFDSEIMGSWGSQLAITFFKDDTADDAWDALPRGTTGYIVILPFGGSGVAGAPAASDPAYVWPVESGAPNLPQSAANERQTFTIEFAVTDEPSFTASVAA